MIKKEEFKFEDAEKYIENAYVYENNEFLLRIPRELFDDETINYINNIINMFFNKKREILDYIVESKKGIFTFYNKTYGYDKEFIKSNLGRPYISINFRKDENTPNAKFNYIGLIQFIETILDEHIIEVEFVDDLVLIGDSICING